MSEAHITKAEFELLMRRVLDGIADEGELAAFTEALRGYPECMSEYVEFMSLIASAQCLGEHGCFAAGQPESAGLCAHCADKPCPAPVSFVRSFPFRKLAVAAAAIILAAAGLWLAAGGGRRAPVDQCGTAAVTPVADTPPIEVFHHWAACNLEVPESLPGTMRMSDGQIKARLGSGIEMILLGPFEMEVQTPKEARLESGRMLATIPWKHGGFMLRTPDLEMWDNGAVYCASVTDRGSDIFVFKGEAQVVEASGEPVDICRAGEGVRVRRDGSGTVKVEANWPEGEHMLARVMTKGVLDYPEEALLAASHVSDGWAKRWMPKVVEKPKPVPGLSGGRQPAAASRQSGSRIMEPEPQQTSIDSGGAVPAASKGGKSSALTTAALPQKEEEAMKATVKSAAAVAAAATMGAGAAWALPAVSNVNMQQIPYTRQVRITYDLSDENAIVTLSIETNGVALPDSAVTSLSGDVCKVVGTGTGKTIIWNAGVDWPENEVDNARARVTAWSVDAPPQVMMIDLAGGPATNSYPVYYYTSVEALPHGGLTNEIYKAARLVMRKINRGTFMIGEGSTSSEVTLTQDFYAGVFQVTQWQWFNVMGTQPANFTDVSSRAFRPVEKVSYSDIRGSTAGAGWPANDAVDADSFMGTLRTKTGLAGLDLPTEAQWEYACRAGTTTCFNDGNANANVGVGNDFTNEWLNVLGRYRYNGGYLAGGATAPNVGCGPANGTAIVGSYLPNAWGLYDMHGNVYEWCLDWHAAGSLAGGVDPKGPATSSSSIRVARGGGWDAIPHYTKSATRSGNVYSTQVSIIGFRLFRTLP
jgi:formylglycine-generating enzyme required for sulfatase activity